MDAAKAAGVATPVAARRATAGVMACSRHGTAEYYSLSSHPELSLDRAGGGSMTAGARLTVAPDQANLMRMKRTNLVLDENLLEEAVRLSGERTYSRTVERALEDFVRRVRAGRILELAGSGLWEGNLAEMRRDRQGRRARRPAKDAP